MTPSNITATFRHHAHLNEATASANARTPKTPVTVNVFTLPPFYFAVKPVTDGGPGDISRSIGTGGVELMYS
jgi:hypothetical protein